MIFLCEDSDDEDGSIESKCDDTSAGSGIKGSHLRGGGRTLVAMRTRSGQPYLVAKVRGRTALNIIMMTLGSHVVEVRQGCESNALELLQCDHVVLVLVQGVQYGIDNDFGLSLVFFIILRTRRYFVSLPGAAEMWLMDVTLDFFCEYT